MPIAAAEPAFNLLAMDDTPRRPRSTKIVFTLGPATESEAMLEKLILAGADVARLNMAHATHEWTRAVVRRIRSVSQKVGREIAIMMDITGPEIRTGDVEAPMELRAASHVTAARRLFGRHHGWRQPGGSHPRCARRSGLR